jgi:hypothetical protein
MGSRAGEIEKNDARNPIYLINILVLIYYSTILQVYPEAQSETGQTAETRTFTICLLLHRNRWFDEINLKKVGEP